MSFRLYYFTGLAALILASVSAYFSITGLGALYAAAFYSVVIMGSAIELSKLAATVWLHRNYKHSNKAVVFGMAFLVIGAMFITSCGVYGYLTSGHSNQETPITENQLQIDRYEARITAEQQTIDREEARLHQLDGVVQTLINYDKISGPDGARAVRESQADERALIQQTINQSYESIDDLQNKKLTLQQGLTKIEAKLGPVKYLAMLFNADTNNTVVYFTFLLVILLDPFAVLLVIATSISYDGRNDKIIVTNVETMDSNNKPKTSLEIDISDLDESEISDLLENETVQNNLINNPTLLNEIETKVQERNAKIKSKEWISVSQKNENRK